MNIMFREASCNYALYTNQKPYTLFSLYSTLCILQQRKVYSFALVDENESESKDNYNFPLSAVHDN